MDSTLHSVNLFFPDKHVKQKTLCPSSSHTVQKKGQNVDAVVVAVVFPLLNHLSKREKINNCVA